MDQIKVLYFTAPWCTPCKVFLPEVEATCKEQGVNLTVYDVHLDAEATQRYSVKSVPTLIILHGEDMRFRASGIMPRQQLINELQRIGG